MARVLVSFGVAERTREGGMKRGMGGKGEAWRRKRTARSRYEAEMQGKGEGSDDWGEETDKRRYWLYSRTVDYLF